MKNPLIQVSCWSYSYGRPNSYSNYYSSMGDIDWSKRSSAGSNVHYGSPEGYDNYWSSMGDIDWAKRGGGGNSWYYGNPSEYAGYYSSMGDVDWGKRGKRAYDNWINPAYG